MKKRVLLLIVFSIFLVSFVMAADGENELSIDDKAYACLAERFNTSNCNGLSAEGKVFALLTLGECKDELLEDSRFESNIKITSQAVLALDKVGIDTTSTQDWLWSQTQIPTDMVWYLQIDSSEATTCNIFYEGGASAGYSVDIGEDKKLSSGAGICLTRANGNYWLEIDSSCYDKEFEVSCDKDFLTTLLFKNPGEATIHVSADSTSSQADGTTIESINLKCFAKNGICDYEGTLWATLVLSHLGTTEDMTPIKFYLTTLHSIYPQYLPSAFLYSITGLNEFENKLIQSQSSAGFWKSSSNKYYDTALALLSVPSGSVAWEDALTWLEKEQMENGCWNSNNFVDTAFIVYSVWPRGVSLGSSTSTSDPADIPTDEGESCIDAGYFCMSGVSCEGSILEGYDCQGFDKCCSQEQTVETCDDLNGEICNSNQKCVSGTSESTFDLGYGQTCCVGGACEEKSGAVEEYTCVSNGGVCRIEGCRDGEESSFDTCEFGDTCCVESTTKESNYLWVWILVFLVLIVLLAIGIVKRDKLRELWFRLKSKFKKSPPSTPGVGKPITRMGAPQRMMPRRRPPTRRPSRIARPSSKAPNEINDVLKKLKDMGK